MTIIIHHNADTVDGHYTIRRDDGLWWTGLSWTDDHGRAALFCDVDVLQNEIERFAGVEVRRYGEVAEIGQLSLF